MVSFSTESESVRFNFMQHVKATAAMGLKGAGDIFIGVDGRHPERRTFRIVREAAAGTPESTDTPGTYVWYDTATARWFIKWTFHEALDVYKGIVAAAGISDVKTHGFVRNSVKSVSDLVLINQGSGEFKRLCLDSLQHQQSTVATTVADFNNDGWVDVFGVRHGEQGSVNGRPFILTNHAGRAFSLQDLPVRDRDRLHRSDLVAHGFFDHDDKPDVVITNGYGQIPGTFGVTQLLLNRSPQDYMAILVRLRGTTANSFAVGARATLKDASENLLGYRVAGINTNISQDTYWLHFGLGETQGPYELSVDWPDGRHSRHVLKGPGRSEIVQP